MPRFKSSNIVINFDENVVRAKDPGSNQMVYTANPAKAASAWEADVISCLESLYIGSRVSRMLFDAIHQAGYDATSGKYTRFLVIQPYTPEQEKASLCNANASPNDYGMSATTHRQDLATAQAGKGLGSTTVIRFDKARWVTGTKCGGFGNQAGGTFYDVLLHEMLHGLRQMAGQQDMSSLPRNWTSMEEFYAILITNVSISERGRKQFRKNHAGFAALEPALSTSVGFLTDPDHLKWVNWLHSRNAVFFRKVGEVEAPFNPIREFMKNYPAWQVVLRTNPK